MTIRKYMIDIGLTGRNIRYFKLSADLYDEDRK